MSEVSDFTDYSGWTHFFGNQVVHWELASFLSMAYLVMHSQAVKKTRPGDLAPLGLE